jgi:hypothetical protein
MYLQQAELNRSLNVCKLATKETAARGIKRRVGYGLYDGKVLTINKKSKDATTSNSSSNALGPLAKPPSYIIPAKRVEDRMETS